MKARAHQIGAVFYMLWGVLHVVTGASLLVTGYSSGAADQMRAYGSAAAGTIPETLPVLVASIGGFHAWNLLWIGALVTIVAIVFNWRNRKEGVWLNGILAGAASIGLIAFLLAPGYMPWTEGAAGIALFVPALLLTVYAASPE